MSARVIHVSPQADPTEWDAMWAALVVRWGGDAADSNPAFGGEVWQYMGTHPTEDGFGWEHLFRHRMHPRTGRREYCTCRASHGFHRAHPELGPWFHLGPADHQEATL